MLSRSDSMLTYSGSVPAYLISAEAEHHMREIHLSPVYVANDPQPSKMHSFIEKSQQLSLSFLHRNPDLSFLDYQTLIRFLMHTILISDRGWQYQPGGDDSLGHDVSHGVRDKHPQHSQKRWVRICQHTVIGLNTEWLLIRRGLSSSHMSPQRVTYLGNEDAMLGNGGVIAVLWQPGERNQPGAGAGVNLVRNQQGDILLQIIFLSQIGILYDLCS